MDIEIWVKLFNFLDHLVQDFVVCRFLSFTADCFSIPEDKGVDPLVTVPALVMGLAQEIPLAATRHLLFETNNTSQDHLI